MDIHDRLRKSHAYAKALGFVAGFPTFYEPDQEVETVQGVILFNSNCCKVKNIPANELGNIAANDIAERFQAITKYALKNGFGAGFPTFYERNLRGRHSYEAVLIHSSIVESRKISTSELGNTSTDNIKALFQVSAEYAFANGFAIGFPTFLQAEERKTACTIMLIHSTSSTREAFVAEAPISLSHFTFDRSISQPERDKLLQCHSVAVSSINQCNSLHPAEKQRLLQTYAVSIHHLRTTDFRVNATAVPGSRAISINFANLFPQGDIEISQTLIHEMMHLARFTHPLLTINDHPFDRGPYYGSAPLRAEICIAGNQNAPVAGEPEILPSFGVCEEVNGTFMLLNKKPVDE